MIRGLCTLIAIAVAAPVAMFPGAVAAKERSFEATIVANAHLYETDIPWILRNEETGEGDATYLGHFTWADVEFADFSEADEVHVIATFTMTADNGDQLYGEFRTVGHFPDPVTLAIHGTYRFTGGTGQFAGATGHGRIDAVGLLTEGLPVTGTMSGTIDF